jgi:hypothetical protein
MAENDCKSKVCRARLHTVLGEVQKSNQIVRSLTIILEEDRVAAARHVLHLEALRKYQIDNHKSALTMEDVENLYEEGEVLEKPDVVMGNDNQISLTSQSLSFTGFTDSDSDYIPTS